MKRLVLQNKPQPNETFTVDGITFTVMESEAYLELAVTTERVSETLSDAKSFFTGE